MLSTSASIFGWLPGVGTEGDHSDSVWSLLEESSVRHPRQAPCPVVAKRGGTVALTQKPMWPLLVDPFSLYNETAGLERFNVVLSEKSALKCSVQL